MADKETKDYWSECGQIFFYSGKGYGLTDRLQTVCLGSEDDIKKIDIKTQVVIGIERGERIRQGAVMVASGALTPDEFRDLVGLDPLTDEQKDEIIRNFGPGRTGQFDRTVGDINSDFVRRTDSDSRNPSTAQSRRDRQTT